MFALTNASRSVLRASSLRVASAATARLESTRLYSSTMHDNDPEVLEREKTRNLSKTHKKSSPHEHAPGWNETLASASEAGADRSTGSPHELQSSTVEYLKARREETDGDGTASTSAVYTKDEVSGPLTGKGQGKDEVIVTKEKVVTSDGSADELLKK